ncbi:hypothetical protein [Caballeronia sp. LjRoot31]|uniref:hypothetical protein n=1 Tax=Caballeronia sp. LjRoot31 TaxID=3342324 RepID=UPI003F5049AB
MDSLGVCDNAIGGHWDCGAISAIATRTCLDHMAAVANWLQYTGSSGVINAARTHALAADRLHALTPSECRCAVPKHRDHPCLHRAGSSATKVVASRPALWHLVWRYRRAEFMWEPYRLPSMPGSMPEPAIRRYQEARSDSVF